MTEQATGDDELRHKFAAFVSHATGGRTSDISLPLNTLSVMASQKVNDAWQAALEKGRAEAIATLSPNGVSQSVVERAERDIEAAMICLAKRAEEIGTHPPSWKELAKEAARAALNPPILP